MLLALEKGGIDSITVPRTVGRYILETGEESRLELIEMGANIAALTSGKIDAVFWLRGT